MLISTSTYNLQHSIEHFYTATKKSLNNQCHFLVFFETGTLEQRCETSHSWYAWYYYWNWNKWWDNETLEVWRHWLIKASLRPLCQSSPCVLKNSTTNQSEDTRSIKGNDGSSSSTMKTEARHRFDQRTRSSSNKKPLNWVWGLTLLA